MVWGAIFGTYHRLSNLAKLGLLFIFYRWAGFRALLRRSSISIKTFARRKGLPLTPRPPVPRSFYIGLYYSALFYVHWVSYFTLVYLLVCTHLTRHACGVRVQLVGVGSLILPRGSWLTGLAASTFTQWTTLQVTQWICFKKIFKINFKNILHPIVDHILHPII